MIGVFYDSAVFHMEAIVILGTPHSGNLGTVTNLYCLYGSNRHQCLSKGCIKLTENRISDSGRNTVYTTLNDTTCTVILSHTAL